MENSVTYGYHATDGRLENVANPSTSFIYSYELNSYGLIKTVTSPVHTVTNTYEANRDILTSKQNVAGAFTRSSYTYGVNEIGQRTDLTTTFDLGGNLSSNPGDTDWGYNSKGEVTKADHTIPGLDRAYVFDSIGNRLKTAEGTTNSNDPSAINYTPNALNQYTAINNQSSIINPQFDADGNMTSGSLPANVNANSTLVWDGENRLIEAQVSGGGTAIYLYDSRSRRVAETVGSVTKITIYDGWNPIAEYSISNNQYSISKSFTWGIDLSGTMQGAGGVGGLLAVTDSIGTYFPTYDGNGNVSEYLDSTGNVSAHYEYDPFGKTTVATGPKANDFAHRFSTKPLDATTGLYYYGYRYYDPVTGHWLSRDPIEEEGGISLYAFVYNDPHNWFDDLGHKPKKEQERERKKRDEVNEKNRESNQHKKVNNNNADITQRIIDAANRRQTATEEVGELLLGGLSDAALVIAHGNGVKKCKELFAANKIYCPKCMVCEFFVNGMRPLQGLVEAPERWAMPFARVMCKDTNTFLDAWWSSYLIDIHIDENGQSRGINLGRKYFSISSADIESN